MKLSIIIPTRNAAEYLPGLFKKLDMQSVKPCELIVIDSSSEDNTREIAKSYGARTIVIPKKDFDHGGTRALAAQEAGGDILVFLTQDILFADSHALENLIRPLSSNSGIAAVFGRQLPNPDASPVASHLRLFNYPDTSYTRSFRDRETFGFKTIFLSNSFAAYRKSALEKIGWFKEGLIFGEDTHAAARLLLEGHTIAYAADAMVYHSHDYTPLQEFSRYFDVGVFHKTENWLIKEFGSTRGEGKKYIQSGISYLMKHKISGIPSFMFRNALKYLGYNLGLKYSRLPKGLGRRISMNKNWWGNRH